jgi:hypothetical protein
MPCLLSPRGVSYLEIGSLSPRLVTSNCLHLRGILCSLSIDGDDLHGQVGIRRYQRSPGEGERKPLRKLTW